MEFHWISLNFFRIFDFRKPWRRTALLLLIILNWKIYYNNRYLIMFIQELLTYLGATLTFTYNFHLTYKIHFLLLFNSLALNLYFLVFLYSLSNTYIPCEFSLFLSPIRIPLCQDCSCQTFFTSRPFCPLSIHPLTSLLQDPWTGTPDCIINN